MQEPTTRVTRLTPPTRPPRIPFLSTLPWMVADPLAFFRRVTREHGGVVDLGSLGLQRVFLVTAPECLEHVLLRNAGGYIKGESFKAMKLLTGEGLVTSEGPRWKRQRRIVQPAFHRQKVLGITALIAEVAEETSARWNARTSDDPLDLSEEMTRTTRAVLMRAVLGVSEPAQEAALAQAWDVAFETITSRLLNPFQFPLSWPTPANVRFRRARGLLDSTAYSILAERRANPDESRRDLLALLLGARDEETGAPLTDEELRDEIMTFFAGGFETSAMALAWVFHLLGEHPEVEATLRAELDAVLGGRTPTGEDLANLPYTRMVIEETMRLYPGAWIFLRTSVAPDVVGGVAIPAGAIVLVSPYVTHRLPEYWEHPDTFDPSRFPRATPSTRPRFAYLPFGGGPRQCIGDIFAMTELQVILAVLVQRHRMRPVPGFRVTPMPMAALRPKKGPMMYVSANGAGPL